LKEDLAHTVWLNKRKEITGEIYFSADFRLCDQLRYFCNDIRIPIISNKIIDLIDESYKVLYQFHLVIMFDNEYMNPFENGKIKTDVGIREDFSIISFTNKLDVIDYERSHILERKF
jgi:hypothetical protein